MKNTFLLGFTLLCLFSISVTSCSNDDPSALVANVLKAEFSITEHPEDDSTITLVNTSEHAVSYHWTFGDGNTSTEEHPIHTYVRPERESDYTVELIAKGERGNSSYYKQIHTVLGTKDLESEGDVEQPEKPVADFKIELDGDFSDWKKVPTPNLASTILDEDNTSLHSLKEVKLCANKDFIYIYIKLDKLHANAMDLYINTDGKKSTGYNGWMWKDLGANYLMQATFEDNYDFHLKPYDESKGGEWGWLPEIVLPGEGLFEKSKFIELEGTIVAFEGRIKRAMIPNLGKEVRIAIGHSGVEGDAWSTSGGLPTVLDGDKNEPLLVKLP